MKLYTYDPGKGKNVLAGEILVDKDNTSYFLKKVSPKHFMVKMRGYGISEDILKQLLDKGVRKIVIQTKKATFTSALADWLAQPTYNFGHGKQCFLSSHK